MHSIGRKILAREWNNYHHLVLGIKAGSSKREGAFKGGNAGKMSTSFLFMIMAFLVGLVGVQSRYANNKGSSSFDLI